ncbi:MAG: class I tRNA ligase family protein [Candidatus Limnocylindrales bacterium]
MPERFEKTWAATGWTNIRDWNVSRQLWWGHRIPAWYCPDGHVTVSPERRRPPALRRRAAGRRTRAAAGRRHLRHLVQSSGLWPFSTLGWPDRDAGPRRFYPTPVMETGYDIIFFWVARMMMLGTAADRPEPFHTVYLSRPGPRPGRHARCPRRRATSSTRSSVIDETGADALRFALIHGADPGAGPALRRPARLEHARNFANKLWNATRFVVGARPADRAGRGTAPRPATPDDLGPAERWMLSRCRAPRPGPSIGRWPATAWARCTRLLEEAIRGELCDRGVELAKVRLADENLPGHPRGDLVDAGGRAGHVPAPAAPGDAVRHGGAVGRDPASGERSRATHRGSLARRRAGAGVGAGERDLASEAQVGAVLELICALRNAARSARGARHLASHGGCRRPSSSRRSRHSSPPSSASAARDR